MIKSKDYNNGLARGEQVGKLKENRRLKTQIITPLEREVAFLQEELLMAQDQIRDLEDQLEAYREIVIVDPYDL